MILLIVCWVAALIAVACDLDIRRLERKAARRRSEKPKAPEPFLVVPWARGPDE